MTRDHNKNMKYIHYNHLNLPTLVVFNSGDRIMYIYDAQGTKLAKQVMVGSASTYTYYAGAFIYEQDSAGEQLAFFSQLEGYVEKNGGAFSYVYQHKDHLGNVRLSYKNPSTTGVALQIVEENNYYPFGLKHKAYNNQMVCLDHKYVFGGKEEQNELGFDWIDITARNYDPALGRWMNLDPMAEQMRRHSPYNYAFDNPIFFTDPDGMAPSDVYIGARTGKVLGTDKDGHNGVARVIDDVEWDDTINPTSDEGTISLHAKSSIIIVDNASIKRDVLSNDLFTSIFPTAERQTLIGLKIDMSGDIPTTTVTSVQGEIGTDGETKFGTSTIPLRKDDKGNITQSREIFTGTSLIPLAQSHSHNKTQLKNHINLPGTSEQDAITAANRGIPIFATDSYKGLNYNGNSINVVYPDGITAAAGTSHNNNIGTLSLQHLIKD